MNGATSRALISVFDKSGVSEFAAGLIGMGWEILASGGTARTLESAGLPVIDVADHTGSPVMLGHRVVTLHPRIHGGILADRHDPQHRADLERFGIDTIDLVVVNLYPFESDPGIDTIDIGGPTLLRAAAKNHTHVAVVADPGDYLPVLDELTASGWLSAQTRRRLARKAFAHACAHDASIISWFDAGEASPEQAHFPQSVHLALERAENLRYGENPLQRAARYRRWGHSGFFDRVKRRSGGQLSYLNLADATAAWTLARDLASHTNRVGAVIVKHANPCGAAVAGSGAEAYRLAFECDRQSAFGGVVAIHGELDGSTVEALARGAQADVVIATGYAPGTIERLHDMRASTRVLEVLTASGTANPLAVTTRREQAAREPAWMLRQLGDEFLIQDAASHGSNPESGRLSVAGAAVEAPAVATSGGADAAEWTVVTAIEPTAEQMADAMFAWRVCASVSSNAVVLARGCVAWGIGAGQPNRSDSGRIAAQKAAGRAEGGACASDGFYPFADGIEAAAAAGVAVVVQPGGSINDAGVIAAADRLGLCMLFTGQRQFRH